jgi:hypothetical protein
LKQLDEFYFRIISEEPVIRWVVVEGAATAAWIAAVGAVAAAVDAAAASIPASGATA